MHIFAGTAVALCAAIVFGLGIVLQAEVARKAPAEDALRVRLLARLVRSPRWVIGALAALVGWSLHVVALTLAPVTLVQPALAFTVVVVLVIAAPMLNERVGRAEVIAAGAIAAGIVAVASDAPARSGAHTPTGTLLITATVLAAVAIAPLVMRPRERSMRWLPLAAGAAFALSSIATKLLADSSRNPVAVAACLAVIALASAVGAIDEMSAFRTLSAVAVVPVVLATEMLLPVAAAPLLFGEHWATTDVRAATLVIALAVVTAGVVALGRTRVVATGIRGAPELR